MGPKLKFAVLLSVGVAAFVVGYGTIAHAWSWPIYSRNSSYGYFLDTHDNDGSDVFPNNSDTSGCAAASGSSIPASVNTATEFINFIECKLNSTNSSSSYKAWEKISAAFIIDTMMGTSRNHPPTAAQITAWENMVNDYSAQGYVTWSTTISYSLNTFYQGTNSGTNPVDDAFYADSSSAAAIVFNNGHGSYYAIRRLCGNPVSSQAALAAVDWSLTGATTSSVSSVSPSQTVTYTNTVKNAGPDDATYTWYIRYCWDACAGDSTYYTSGYSSQTSGPVTNQASGSTSTVYTWAYVVPAATTHTQMCVWVGYTYATGPRTSAGWGTMKCVSILQATPSCGVMTVAPSPVGPTDTYTIHSSVQVTGGSAQATNVNNVSNYYVHISGPGAPANNDNVTPVTIGTSGTYGTLTTDYAPGPMNSAGTYSVTWGIVGTLGNINCGPQTFTIAYSPYFSVVAGDIAAGPGFGDGSCNENPVDIESWNDNTTRAPNYFGGGSEFGALATGDITNFVSGLGLVGNASPPVTASFIAPPNSGHGLSFANSSNSPESNAAPNYGGASGTLPCIDDYFGTEDSVTPTSEPSQITNAIMGTLNGIYSSSPDPVLNYVTLGDAAHTPISIAAGKTITLYVSGNVYIDSNIVYGAYALGTVPRFNLYVSGNIYIDPAVTELHGVYIAQKSAPGSGGITTCATPTAVTEPYATCTNKLLVVGSMAAEGQLKLARTHGNLTAASAAGVLAEPAEIFQYSPEMWLNAPPLTSLNVKAYTSLPPVL